MLKYIRCLLLTIFTPLEESTVLFLHSNHISRSVCEKPALHPPAALRKSSCLTSLAAATVESPFQAHLTRCSMKTKRFVEVSSRCVSLLTTTVCHTPVLFPHLLQRALALTVYRWKHTPWIPTLKTKDFENNNSVLPEVSISSRRKQAMRTSKQN